MSTDINIVRSKHTPENSTVINNDLVNDPRLSANSICFMLFLLRHADAANPQSLDVKSSDLADRFRLSLETVRKSLNQLEKYDYLARKPNGRFILPANVIAENTLYLTAEELEAWDNEMANQQ
jgi:hypothetical protein